MTITKDTILGDILDAAPETAPLFIEIDRFVDGVRRQGAHADERRGKALQLCVERKACVHKGYSFIIGCLAKKHNGRAYFFTCRPVGTAAKQAAGINRSGP